MKKNLVLAMTLLTAIGITSCSKSDDNVPSGKEDNVLLVQLPNNVISSRAIEDQTHQAATEVKDVTVFLMAGQSVVKAEEFTNDELEKGYKRFEKVPSHVNNVIVVANKIVETLLDLNNATEIKNYAYEVASQHSVSGLNGKTLMGEGEIPLETVAHPNPDPNDPDRKYKVVSVSLNAITARIEVGAVCPGVGVEEVELVAISINNFYKRNGETVPVLYGEQSPMWYVLEANSKIPGKGYEDAIGKIWFSNSYDPAEYRNLADNDQVVLHFDSKVYAFHVFQGNVPHVVMLVKLKLADGYYEVGDNGEKLQYKYGYLTFTKFRITDNVYVDAMKGNNIYKMGVGTTGIPVNAKDVTDKPEKGPYDLGVEIVITPWSENHVKPEV